MPRRSPMPPQSTDRRPTTASPIAPCNVPVTKKGVTAIPCGVDKYNSYRKYGETSQYQPGVEVWRLPRRHVVRVGGHEPSPVPQRPAQQLGRSSSLPTSTRVSGPTPTSLMPSMSGMLRRSSISPPASSSPTTPSPPSSTPTTGRHRHRAALRHEQPRHLHHQRRQLHLMVALARCQLPPEEQLVRLRPGCCGQHRAAQQRL